MSGASMYIIPLIFVTVKNKHNYHYFTDWGTKLLNHFSNDSEPKNGRIGFKSCIMWLQSLYSIHSPYHFYYIGREAWPIFRLVLVNSPFSMKYSLWHRHRHGQQENPGWAQFPAPHLYHLWQTPRRSLQLCGAVPYSYPEVKEDPMSVENCLSQTISSGLYNEAISYS